MINLIKSLLNLLGQSHNPLKLQFYPNVIKLIYNQVLFNLTSHFIFHVIFLCV